MHACSHAFIDVHQARATCCAWLGRQTPTQLPSILAHNGSMSASCDRMGDRSKLFHTPRPPYGSHQQLTEQLQTLLQQATSVHLHSLCWMSRAQEGSDQMGHPAAGSTIRIRATQSPGPSSRIRKGRRRAPAEHPMGPCQAGAAGVKEGGESLERSLGVAGEAAGAGAQPEKSGQSCRYGLLCRGMAHATCHRSPGDLTL